MSGRYEYFKRAYHEIVELYKKGEYGPMDRTDLYEAIKAVYDQSMMIYGRMQRRKSSMLYNSQRIIEYD